MTFAELVNHIKSGNWGEVIFSQWGLIFAVLGAILSVLGKILQPLIQTAKAKKAQPLNNKKGFFKFETIEYKSNKKSITLHDYLYSENQRYYGWKDYQKENPKKFSGSQSHLNDEALLLEALLTEESQPLLLIGEGGCGKTRLSLELGRRLKNSYCKKRCWVVYKAPAQLDKSALEELITRAKLHNKKVLLILDYVETLSGDLKFDELYDSYMKGENGDYLRWILTCRSTYFGDIKNRPAHLNAHHLAVINLSDNEEWLTGWQRQACQEIQANTKQTTPILSVIEKYLTFKNKAIEQLDTQYQWVWTLLRRSIPETTDEKEYNIGELVTLFPLPQTSLEYLSKAERNIITAWQTDGWLHLDSTTKEYRLGHDILADYSLLQTLMESENAKVSLEQFWRKSRLVKSQPAYFTTLQRILPTMAMHFSLYALLEKDESTQVALKHRPFYADTLTRGGINAMAIASFSLNWQEKERVFSSKLGGFQLDELNKVFKDEKINLLISLINMRMTFSY